MITRLDPPPGSDDLRRVIEEYERGLITWDEWRAILDDDGPPNSGIDPRIWRAFLNESPGHGKSTVD